MMMEPCQQAGRNKKKKAATRMKKFYLANEGEPKRNRGRLMILGDDDVCA